MMSAMIKIHYQGFLFPIGIFGISFERGGYD